MKVSRRIPGTENGSSRLEAIAIRWEAIARLETIAVRAGAIAIRVETMAIAIGAEAGPSL